MYAKAGRLYQVFNASLMNYRRLLDHINKIRWEVSWEYALVTINHFALKLHMIRNSSKRRFTLVLRTYILLQEGAAADWLSSSVQGKILKWTTKNRVANNGLSDAPDTAPAPTMVCDHCQVKHLGGVAWCPFKSSKVSATDSRRLAKAVTGTQHTKAWLNRAYKAAQEFLGGGDRDKPSTDV